MATKGTDCKCMTENMLSARNTGVQHTGFLGTNASAMLLAEYVDCPLANWCRGGAIRVARFRTSGIGHAMKYAGRFMCFLIAIFSPSP